MKTAFYKLFKQCSRHFIPAMLAGLLITAPAHSQSNQDSTWRMALGGYAITRYDSSVSLSPDNGAVSASLDPEEVLGLENDQTVFRFDGYFRFLPKQYITYSWYRITSDARKSLETEIDWVDRNGDPITLPAGAGVESDFRYDIHKLGYRWAFYQSDRVELTVGGGLHITRLAFDLDADTTSSGARTEKASTSLPLPVVSFRLAYDISDRFHWYFNSEFFALSFDNRWEGIYTDSALGMEYQLSDHWALGGGIGNNSIKLSEENDNRKLEFENRITGIQFYLSTYF